MREVLRQLIGALERGRELLICQVVETRGSTPQKAGALMLVDPDGGQAGTLGGGCVEAEVKQKAIRRIGQAGAELHAFVLDHDYAWADGLICGGKMVIVTEAVRGPGRSPISGPTGRCWRRATDSPRPWWSIPSAPGRAVGARFLFDHEGALRRGLAGVGQLPRAVAGRSCRLSDRPQAGGPDGRGVLADARRASTW